MDIDLTQITITQVFTLLAILAITDFVTAIVASFVPPNTFSSAVITDFLVTHVAKIIFPIFALAVIGHGIPALDVPAIGPAFALALTGLTAYAVATIGSLAQSLNEAKIKRQ